MTRIAKIIVEPRYRTFLLWLLQQKKKYHEGTRRLLLDIHNLDLTGATTAAGPEP